MKRPVRNDDGMYHLEGKKFKAMSGSRQQVWNGTVFKTPGGLKRGDLLMNKHRRIVSNKKYQTAKMEHRQKKRLFAKYTAKKGKFGAIKLDSPKTGKSKKRVGGGKGIESMMSPYKGGGSSLDSSMSSFKGGGSCGLAPAIL